MSVQVILQTLSAEIDCDAEWLFSEYPQSFHRREFSRGAEVVRVVVMQLLCPMCSMTITANPPKAGRFTPKCPKCEKPFVVTVTVQTVDEYKSANEKANPPTTHKHDPDATFASQAGARVEQDANSTFASPTPAASVHKPNVDPDATFASQAGSRPVMHDPDSTFASQTAKPSYDPDQTEATGGYLPRAQANDDVDKTNVVDVAREHKPALSSRTRTVSAVVLGALLAFLAVPVSNLLGVNIPDVGPLKPTHLLAILGIVTGVLGFFLLGRK